MIGNCYFIVKYDPENFIILKILIKASDIFISFRLQNSLSYNEILFSGLVGGFIICCMF